MSSDQPIAVRFRDSLRRLYVLDPPAVALLKRVRHLMEMGELPRADGEAIIVILERVLNAQGHDPNEVGL